MLSAAQKIPATRPTPKRRARLASVSSIVARSYPGKFIGIDNQLPWHLPTDLKHFKSTTNGKPIIMGRKTFESIGRPLPNRYNIVLSRIREEDRKNLIWANSLESALYFADVYAICNKIDEIFIIGGSQMYSLFDKFVNKIYLTEVYSGLINGDAKFEFDFPIDKWKTKSEVEFPATETDQYPFRISVLRKRLPHLRNEFLDDFLDPSGEKKEWRRRAMTTAGIESVGVFEQAAVQFAFSFPGDAQCDEEG